MGGEMSGEGGGGGGREVCALFSPPPGLQAPLSRCWRAGIGTTGSHSGFCNPIPGGAGEGKGQRRPAGWVSEGAAGNERGKSRCRRFPRAGRRLPALRPGCSCRRLPRSAAGGAGGASGSQATLGLSGHCGPPQKAPGPASLRPRPPSKAQLKEGGLLASQELPAEGRGLALGLFLPDGPQSSPAQLLALLPVSCFRGLLERRAFAGLH